MRAMSVYDISLLHDQKALRGPAFYVGALGSRRVAAQRLSLLHAVGIDRDLLERLHAPIGLIPSRRDPRELSAVGAVRQGCARSMRLNGVERCPERSRATLRPDGIRCRQPA